MTNEGLRHREIMGQKAGASAACPLNVCTALILAGLLLCPAHSRAAEPAPALPSDTPEKFKPATNSFDYVKREEMVPMRDGIKLKTFVLIPKGATNAPMLLSRTPYNASSRVERSESPHLAAVVPQMDDTAVAA